MIIEGFVRSFLSSLIKFHYFLFHSMNEQKLKKKNHQFNIKPGLVTSIIQKDEIYKKETSSGSPFSCFCPFAHL